MLMRVFAWLLMFAVPLQALDLAMVQLRGPAHIHADDQDDDDDDDVHHHHQMHASGERHYHSHADGVILLEEVDHHHELAGIEAGSLKGDASAGFAALIPTLGRLSAPERSQLLRAREPIELRTRYLGRLERPPRLLFA
jgi:hypothetical protein